MKWLKKAAKVPSEVSTVVRQDYEVAKERKQMKKARVKPKGYWLRKMGAALFWLAFLFMLFILGNSLFAGDQVASKDEPSAQNSKVTSIEATEFAKRFAEAYYTFAPGESLATTREKQLAPFLAADLDRFAGLDVLGTLWKAQVKDTEIVEMKQLSANTAQITVKVVQALTQVKKQDEQGSMSDLPKEKQKLQEAVKYVIVPLAYDGSQFFVYANPLFTYVEEVASPSSVTVKDLKEAPMEIAKEIEVFLPTFFTAYTEGGQEQLNYLFETDNLATSLNKSMIFKEVKHTKIYVLDQSWLVFATVNLMDPTTNSPVETTYQLEITHDLNKQLVVSGFNNYEGLQIIN